MVFLRSFLNQRIHLLEPYGQLIQLQLQLRQQLNSMHRTVRRDVFQNPGQRCVQMASSHLMAMLKHQPTDLVADYHTRHQPALAYPI